MANEAPYAKQVSTADGNLCKLCEDLLGSPFEWCLYVRLPRSFASVQDSRGFCKFCDLIYRKVPRNSSIDQQQLDYTFLPLSMSNGVPSINVTYGPNDEKVVGTGASRRVSGGYSFSFIPESAVHNGQFFPGQLDSAKKSGRAQELTNKWMDDCIRTHADCGTVADRTWRPTRLLDIGKGPGFSHLRLCEGNEITRGVEYMTLSHCWGGSQPIKLTRNTHPQFRSGIAFIDLPRTFREALEIVRRFGKRYIWIDSICILQDSNEDWYKEADAMCAVYRNSYCNIGATGASDSSEGCFIKHTDEVLRISVTLKGVYKHYINPGDTRNFYYFDKEEWEQTFETAPLNKRAWVVQEKLLAPRMLHFGLSQVSWECNELQATERFPESFVGYWPRRSDHKRFAPKTTWDSAVTEQKYQFREPWHEVITAYSRARLTVESDRIPALTGIVDRYKELTSDDFLAGLWRSTIAWDLIWWAVEPGQRYNSYVAPSWSWLSVKDTTICGGPCKPVSLVKPASQAKLCHVLHAEVTQPSPRKSKYTVMDGHIRCWGKVALAGWSSNGPGDSRRRLLVWSCPHTKEPLESHFRADTPEAMDAMEFLLFPVLAVQHKVFLLALERNKEDPTTYRRIGMCETAETDILWAACDSFTTMLHFCSNQLSLEPVVRDDSRVFVPSARADHYERQKGVRGISITIK